MSIQMDTNHAAESRPQATLSRIPWQRCQTQQPGTCSWSTASNAQQSTRCLKCSPIVLWTHINAPFHLMCFLALRISVIQAFSDDIIGQVVCFSSRRRDLWHNTECNATKANSICMLVTLHDAAKKLYHSDCPKLSTTVSVQWNNNQQRIQDD